MCLGFTMHIQALTVTRWGILGAQCPKERTSVPHSLSYTVAPAVLLAATIARPMGSRVLPGLLDHSAPTSTRLSGFTVG